MERARPAARFATGTRILLRAPAQRRVASRSPAKLARLQERAVCSAVAHARRHVPYYRETMRRLGLDEGDFRDAGDLGRLPVIERAQLQSDPEYFVSETVDRRDTVTLQSGGSTGRPVTVLRDRASVVDTSIYIRRAGSVIAGIVGTRRLRAAVIMPPTSSGGALTAAGQASAMFSGSPLMRWRRLSLLEPPAAHTRALDEFRPHLISSYGSYIEQLFVTWEAGERPRHLPTVVTYAADALSDSARTLIRKRFGVRVLSLYQSIEGWQIGFECERHAGHHVNSDLCPVRIADADGRAVAAGESGDVVISDLTNRATVLLNYRLGDVARTLPPCTCGRNLPMISLLEGRTAEWLTGIGGEPIHPQAVKMLLRTEQSIRRYQVIQERRDHFAVALVTALEADLPGLAARLERKFADQFGGGTTTDVRFVEDLPRTGAGKVRPVISLVEGA